jgi:hypothetical protein
LKQAAMIMPIIFLHHDNFFNINQHKTPKCRYYQLTSERVWLTRQIPTLKTTD